MVIPMKCTNCGKEFVAEEGGRCGKCGELFCLACLNIPRNEKDRREPVCGKRKEPGKKYIRASRFSALSIGMREKLPKEKHEGDRS